MAVDPRCPLYVLDAVMADPTAQRLRYLANLSESDLETDLSALIVLAFDVAEALQPYVEP